MAKNDYGLNQDSELGQTGSLFDMSIATLQRIHFSLIQGNVYSSIGDIPSLTSWYNSLSVVDREISPFLSETDEKELEPVRNKASGIPRLSSTRGVSINYYSMAKILDTYERKLRYYMKKYKLYMREREDPGNAMMG